MKLFARAQGFALGLIALGLISTSAASQDEAGRTAAPIDTTGGPLSTLFFCTAAAAMIVIIGGYAVMRARSAHTTDDRDVENSDP